MSSPITWQNINGPSLSDAAAPMMYAGRLFDSAFNGANALLKQQQTTDAANWDNTKLNNTNAILNRIQQEAATPEEFAAKKAAFMDQLGGYGAQVDATTVRNALDTRLGALQQKVITTNAFNDSVATNKAAPILEQHRLLTLQGKDKEAAALEVANPGLKGWAAEKALAIADQEARTQRERATELYGHNKQKWPLELKELQSRLDTEAQARLASAAQIRASDATTALHQGQEADRKEALASARRNLAAQSLLKGTVYEGGVWTGKDSAEGMDILNKSGSNLDAGEKNKIMGRLAQIEQEGGITVQGQKVPLPKDIIKSILAGARDEDWVSGWNEGGVNYLDAALKKAVNNLVTIPEHKDENGDTVKARDRQPIMDGWVALQAAQKAAIADPLPPGKVGSSPKPSGDYHSPKPTKDHKPK